ncbi:MAG: GspH/FimT family pseudopilin [Nanobdellota archaeon]
MDKHGFTLIEVMIVIAVISIISGFAAYNYFSFLPQRKLVNSSGYIYSAMNRAKSEAVKRGMDVVVKFDYENDQYEIKSQPDNLLIASGKADEGINIFDKKGNKTGSVTFDCRGLKPGVNDAVYLCWGDENSAEKFNRVRITTAGSLCIQTSDNYNSGNWK